MSETEPIPPTSSVTALRIPIIKKGEYDLWSMKMRQYIAITDHILWDIITNGNQTTTDPASPSVSAPKTSLAANARRNNEKALNILLSAIPDRHLLSFHDAVDARSLWKAIKARFGGNEASKKMQKNLESQNQDKDGNGNGGGNGNSNGGGNGNGNGGGNGNHGNNNGNGNRNRMNRGAGGAAPVARACTYKDFLNCQPRNFSEAEEVVGLARWFEKMESVYRISNYPLSSQVKFATCALRDGALTWWNSHMQTIGIDEACEMSWTDLMKLMIEVYYLRNEIQKLENELWNLSVKGTDVAGYI
ncbi:putative reverse transcriptase domain-containing protein [Tanacetum coccineum]